MRNKLTISEISIDKKIKPLKHFLLLNNYIGANNVYSKLNFFKYF